MRKFRIVMVASDEECNGTEDVEMLQKVYARGVFDTPYLIDFKIESFEEIKEGEEENAN